MKRLGIVAGLVVTLVSGIASAGSSTPPGTVCVTVNTTGWTVFQKRFLLEGANLVALQDFGLTDLGLTRDKDKVCVPTPVSFDPVTAFTTSRLLTAVAGLALQNDITFGNETAHAVEVRGLCTQLASDEIAWKNGQLNAAQKDAVMYKLLRGTLIQAKLGTLMSSLRDIQHWEDWDVPH